MKVLYIILNATNTHTHIHTHKHTQTHTHTHTHTHKHTHTHTQTHTHKHTHTQVSVTVNVSDVNDNHPIFLVPDGGFRVNVTENTPIGSEVITVSATDRDQGTAAVISYSLVDSSLPFQIPDPTVWSGGIVSSNVGLDILWLNISAVALQQCNTDIYDYSRPVMLEKVRVL